MKYLKHLLIRNSGCMNYGSNCDISLEPQLLTLHSLSIICISKLQIEHNHTELQRFFYQNNSLNVHYTHVFFSFPPPIGSIAQFMMNWIHWCNFWWKIALSILCSFLLKSFLCDYVGWNHNESSMIMFSRNFLLILWKIVDLGVKVSKGGMLDMEKNNAYMLTVAHTNIHFCVVYL